MKKVFKNALRKMGIQIKRYPDPDLIRRIQLMFKLNIEIVFDIGANIGQYSSNLRELGYAHRIISFEPLKSAFDLLQITSSKDDNWSVYNYALGNEDCLNTINVAGNSYSSSIVEMLPSHYESAPESKYVDKQEIEIKRLDTVFSSLDIDSDKIMLKIDTQGFEKNVLEGASKVLNKISLIQLEMSIIPLYKDEILFTEMINYLDKIGFQLVSLENGFSDKSSGQLLQVDGLFANKHLLIKNKLK